MKRLALILLLALALTAQAAGARPAGPAPTCPKAWQAGWQRLADRIKADVYCPSWVPAPLTGQIGGRWNNIDSVDPDRSYLIGFVWQEVGLEIHVNLRAYPGRTAVPTCRSVDIVGGKKVERQVPCFADPRGTKTMGGITATVYTVNQDADAWHVLYAWRHAGTLYTLSQHVATPLSFSQVVKSLDRMLGSLVLVRPRP